MPGRPKRHVVLGTHVVDADEAERYWIELESAAQALWQALGNSQAAIGKGPTPELEMYKWVNTTKETTNAG
ncbi:hypothetical protein LCGC14_2435950 [marine sediment metagenome]|uniref:Uncharacterized protein n=1 Tax=marine sediment metagenome TaxID=412755 RepID=A0A0F9BKF2_9ZZZZ